MIEAMRPAGEGGVSVFEEALRRWIEKRGVQPTFSLAADFRAHGREPVERDEDLPPAVVSFAGLLETGARHLAAARAAARESGRQAAVQARELAAFAAARPGAVLDRPDEEVGAAAAASRAARPAALTDVSEWAVDEVMVGLGLPSQAASAVLAESVTLVHRLPATLAALEDGVIGPAHARMLTELLGPLPDEARPEVEARLLGRAAGKTVPQLRAAARRAVLRADAAAATKRLAAAIRDRQVRMFPGEDGMATLSTTLPLPVAAACRTALRSYADACAVPGDERTVEQRMADCLVDLILRPGETGLPPVQASLTVITSVDTLRGGTEPGEVDGSPVPAVMVRELANALGLLPHPEAEQSPSEPEHDDTDLAPANPDRSQPAAPAEEESDLVEDSAARLAGLLGVCTVTGTALARRPRIAVVEELSGQLLALTDATGLRRAGTCGRPACRTGRTVCDHPLEGRGLGPPGETTGYVPSAALRAFVRARDRRCRFPGCRAAAIRCDLDHTMPWPVGPTSADNLCCLCRHHHRLSHQAPGWRLRHLPDGGLEWTTPGGDRITTHPPAYGTDDHPPPPTPRPTLRELVLGRSQPPRTDDHDPAPF